MFDLYTTDENGLVYNGEDTYRCAALDLQSRSHVAINWTDRYGTVLNILLSYAPTRVGKSAGRLDSGSNKLWVGIVGQGCWAFEVRNGYLHPDYIAEKLGVKGTTAFAVASLIDNIRLELVRAEA